MAIRVPAIGGSAANTLIPINGEVNIDIFKNVSEAQLKILFEHYLSTKQENLNDDAEILNVLFEHFIAQQKENRASHLVETVEVVVIPPEKSVIKVEPIRDDIR